MQKQRKAEVGTAKARKSNIELLRMQLLTCSGSSQHRADPDSLQPHPELQQTSHVPRNQALSLARDRVETAKTEAAQLTPSPCKLPPQRDPSLPWHDSSHFFAANRYVKHNFIMPYVVSGPVQVEAGLSLKIQFLNTVLKKN